MAPVAAEDPAVRRDPESVDMVAENGDKLGRDGHAAGFVGGTVFESAFVVG